MISDIKFIVKVSFKLNNKSTVQTMKGLDMWGLDKKRDVYTIWDGKEENSLMIG